MLSPLVGFFSAIPGRGGARVAAANTKIAHLRRVTAELTTCLQSPVGSWDWTTASAEHLAADSELVLVVAYEQEVVSCVALLARRHEPLAPYAPIGAHAHGEPMDFCYRDADALTRVAHKMADSGLSLYLERVPADSPLRRALCSAYRGRGIVIVRPALPCPYLPLAHGGDLESLSSSLKADLRRSHRKAVALGAVSVEFRSPTDEHELAPLWNTLLKLEVTGWKGRSGTALAYDACRRAFFHAYALAACKAGALQIATLRIGDRNVASHLAIERGKRLWLLKIAYDETYSKCSPGLLLMGETVRYAAKKKLESIEFMGEAAPWTQRWTRHGRQNICIRVYTWSPTGMAILARDATTFALRRGRQFISLAGGMLLRNEVTRSLARRVIARAARGYAAGNSLDDAKRLARTVVERGYGVTLGYWNHGSEKTDAVVSQYRRAMGYLSGLKDSYLSIKPPAYGCDETAHATLLRHAAELNVPLHLDSLAYGTADRAMALLSETPTRATPFLGCTLPGRWERSLLDAHSIARLGVIARVVKGQWPDPTRPDIDPRQGFVAVVHRLAGNVPLVRVATHDPVLIRKCAEILRRTNTACELELLYGLPVTSAVEIARELDLPVRVYIPYGYSWIPYALQNLRRNPRVLWWLFKDALLGPYSRTFPAREKARG